MCKDSREQKGLEKQGARNDMSLPLLRDCINLRANQVVIYSTGVLGAM